MRYFGVNDVISNFAFSYRIRVWAVSTSAFVFVAFANKRLAPRMVIILRKLQSALVSYKLKLKCLHFIELL
jgi:hypothetical protein